MAQPRTGPTLVILAAGLGSRFGGPKQLKPLGPAGNVLLEYTAYDAVRAGFGRIVFIIQSSFADDFAPLVRPLPDGVSVEFAYQDQPPERTKPWGTGHALLAARDLVDGPFVLCNADDYYGTSAFEKAAGFFDGQAPESRHYGILGYRLDATLSGNGSVSRAICNLADNSRLASITEHPVITYRDDVIVSETQAGKEFELHGDDRVSMNFWMLGNSIFELLEPEVRDFIERYRHDARAECRLPDIIQNLMQQHEITVECLPHNEDWFGMTHGPDYDLAASTIQAMHDAGTYPTPLWQSNA